jgi:hypothetical protein
MPNYRAAAQTADKLIQKFGAKGILRKIVAGVKTDTPIAIAVLDYSTREVDGSKILMGDNKIYMTALGGVVPKVGDIVLDANSTPYTVVSKMALSPAGTVVYYKLQGRGLK